MAQPNFVQKKIAQAKITGIGITAAALSQFNKSVGKNFLVNSLSQMPGLPAKFSQLLSIENKPTQITPLDKSIILQIIEERSPNLASQIVELSDLALTASLGQVHWVKLKDQRTMAVKVQYPHVETEVAAQLELLMASLKLSPAKKFGLDIKAYQEFLNDKILLELDYRQEANSQMHFYNGLKDNPWVVVPTVDFNFLEKGILVQSFEDSEFLTDAINYPLEIRNQLGDNLWRLLLLSIFKLKKLHTDPHAENIGYRFDTESKIVLYDFGSTLDLEGQHLAAILELLNSIKERRAVSAFDYFVYLGFNPDHLANIKPVINAVANLIFEPLLTDRPMTMAQWDLGPRLDKILGGNKWWFRTAGPTWFLYFMRSTFGFLNTIEKLGVSVNFHQIFNEVSNGVILPKISVPKSPSTKDEPCLLSMLAQTLRVRIDEEGQEKISLELPVRMVDELEELLDTDTMSKISQRGINVAQIKVIAQRSGYTRQNLFEHTEGQKSYKVWIE